MGTGASGGGRRSRVATNQQTGGGQQKDQNAVKPFSDEQQKKVRHCLATLESSLAVTFQVDEILASVVVTTHRKGQRILSQGAEARGIYVVDEGALEVLSPNGDVVLNRLPPGGFCGELSTLFGVRCSASVQSECTSTLLWLPADVVRENRDGELGEEKMLHWCSKRAYIDMTKMFDDGVLMQNSIVACWKNSIFSKWSENAVNFMARLVEPILFSSDDVIYSPGEESSHIFFVLRGHLQYLRDQQDRSSCSIECSTDGYCFGKEEFLRGASREHGARPLGPSLLVPVTREVLIETANKYPTESPKLKELLQSVQ